MDQGRRQGRAAGDGALHLSDDGRAARPELAGLVLQDDVQAFSFNGVSGTVQNRVVRETASGTLDFYWRIVVDPSSTANNPAIEAFRLIDFGYDFIADLNTGNDGDGRDADASDPGDWVMRVNGQGRTSLITYPGNGRIPARVSGADAGQYGRRVLRARLSVGHAG